MHLNEKLKIIFVEKCLKRNFCQKDLKKEFRVKNVQNGISPKESKF